MNSNKLSIQDEYDLHCKVVDFIRKKYPNALMAAGLGENQVTSDMRIKSWKKGYMSGQCDLMIINPTRNYNSLCLEFKSPAGRYKISDEQNSMKILYVKNKCDYFISNSYDDIIIKVIKHMEKSNRYLKNDK